MATEVMNEDLDKPSPDQKDVVHVMTTEAAQIFRRAVKTVLTDWQALDIAIENGMGGDDAQEKRDWMCQVVVDEVLKNNDTDLEEFIEVIVDDEFDTIIEDGSIRYNVKWIKKFYKDCLEGKQQQVDESLKQTKVRNMLQSMAL